MGVYYELQLSAIVPDGFLSLGVERLTRASGRLSYVIWQEHIVPILAVEFVSKNYGQEYEDKKDVYAGIGILYYVIYNPDYYQRNKHQPFEVYRLVDGEYILQLGERVWIPEIRLGIGRAQGIYQAWAREWLYWYDHNGNRLLSSEERVEQECQKVERLAEKLRQMGIDPDIL